MSVYRVYTNTAKVPVYVLYKCPHCSKVVVTVGHYRISESFSDQGTWTKKGLQKRENAANERLITAAESQAERFRERVYRGKTYCQSTDVQCPACSWKSFLPENAYKPGIVAKILQIAVPAMILILMLVTIFKAEDAVSSVFGLFFGYLIAAVIAFFSIGAIGKKIAFSMAQRKFFNEFSPLLCADRSQLRNVAEGNPAYRDADYSYVEDLPKILTGK